MASRLFAVISLVGLVALPACRGDDAMRDRTSESYRAAVASFYTGLAAVESGVDLGAEERLLRVTELAPQEPAAWANLGLLALRRNEFDKAEDRLARARSLAPENSDIVLLSALLERNRGDTEAARTYLEQAVALDSTNLKAWYALAQGYAQEGALEAAGRALTALREVAPANLVVGLEAVRNAAERGDEEAMQAGVEALAGQAQSWPEAAREQWQALEAAARAGDTAAAATRVAFLRNVLLREPAFRRDLAAVQTPPEQVGEMITRFLRLPPPTSTPAVADDSLSFNAQALTTGEGPWTGLYIVSPALGGPPDLAVVNEEAVRLLGGGSLPAPGAAGRDHALAEVDYDYDFRMDLALAADAGFRLYRRDSTGAFVEVTGSLGLPTAVTGAAYSGVWAADLDLEGDMDLVLGVPGAAPRVLRNNGDGTFTPVTIDGFFPTLEGLAVFVWADLDGDGDPDAAAVDAEGGLHLVTNARGGRFVPATLPELSGRVLALEVGDLDRDARFDLVVLTSDGALQGLSHSGQGTWAARVLETWAPLPGDLNDARLFVADFDNNGGLDLLASTPTDGRLWMNEAEGGYRPLAAGAPANVQVVADFTGDGRLDLATLGPEGEPVRMVNRGTRPYHWKLITPRAAETMGDQRINSYGIGGEIEVRAGLLFQKQLITSPVVHFGLGDSIVADVARIIWPNGSVQAEFDLLSDQVISAQQRLKGSCPWLFTFDGDGMQFVTDFIWRSPLGLKINAQETAGIMATEDWVKIRGDQLVPRDGTYDVRITAELWETHFFDHIALLVVDHPEGTEVLVDERFAIPPPDLRVYVTTPPRPVAGAWDDAGRDVTAVVSARDGHYLDTFGRGQYQGVTRDHFVEVHLGDDAPADGPLWLVASGWVRPTDSSLNVALAQGSHPPPQGLSLEIPDGQGGWVTVRDNLGFPSGKHKTVLLDLDGLFDRELPRRLRLRTNLEIFWDALAWATTPPDTTTHTRRLAPEAADLRYRGFSAVTEADRSSPELPAYDVLAGTGQVWRDLVGYYTRFGDVRELLDGIDDRYVIMNAGDELALRFAAPSDPPDGWVRDYVLIGDGWVKDGDYNTTASTTVLPLPSHDRPAYEATGGRLEDDPVYRRYPGDWQTYHTRYVTPQRFHDALRLTDDQEMDTGK